MRGGGGGILPTSAMQIFCLNLKISCCQLFRLCRQSILPYHVEAGWDAMTEFCWMKGWGLGARKAPERRGVPLYTNPFLHVTLASMLWRLLGQIKPSTLLGLCFYRDSDHILLFAFHSHLLCGDNAQILCRRRMQREWGGERKWEDIMKRQIQLESWRVFLAFFTWPRLRSSLSH